MEQDGRGRRIAGGERRLPTIATLDPADRSPNADTCPFFRSIDAGGRLRTPFEVPHDANRCLAVAEAKPQSIRQQQLVCLTAGHVNCPRYLRGALLARQAPNRMIERPTPSLPILLAGLALVLSAVGSVAFLFARGGMALSVPSAAPSEAAVAPSSAAPTAGPPSADPNATPSPATAAPPSPTPSVPIATPTRPSPTASPAPTPVATSDRYAVLVPCPDAPDCWIYTVRPGDNFQSIVDWFGVPFDTVAAMNPQIEDLANIHVGDEIRMPPPTR